MKTPESLAALNNLRDLDDAAQMSAFVNVLDELGTELSSEAHEVLFRVLERFPEDDGYGTFWTLLHLLEATPDYENELVRSLERQPNEFNVLMLHRMLNVDVQWIGEVEIVDLLRAVVEHPRTPDEVRDLARDLVAENAM